MTSKPLKITVWIISIILILFTSFWLYNKYEDRFFLRYGVLHIDEYPKSLKMIKYETSGISDFEAEYYISIDPSDFNKLQVVNTL